VVHTRVDQRWWPSPRGSRVNRQQRLPANLRLRLVESPLVSGRFGCCPLRSTTWSGATAPARVPPGSLHSLGFIATPSRRTWSATVWLGDRWSER
jgi:hypothetical protein